MLSRLLAFGLFLTVGSAFAEQVRPVVDLPPLDYQGQTYTDANGCEFVRLELIGQGPIWVQKLDHARKPDCARPEPLPLRLALRG